MSKNTSPQFSAPKTPCSATARCLSSSVAEVIRRAGEHVQQQGEGAPSRRADRVSPLGRADLGVVLMALIESPQVCSLNFLTCEQRSV